MDRSRSRHEVCDGTHSKMDRRAYIVMWCGIESKISKRMEMEIDSAAEHMCEFGDRRGRFQDSTITY